MIFCRNDWFDFMRFETCKISSLHTAFEFSLRFFFNIHGIGYQPVYE